MCYRRLVRDDEHTTANSEAVIYWATIIIMTGRLARYETGQPLAKRWGDERTTVGRRNRRQEVRYRLRTNVKGVATKVP
jgi:hypothetical protein